MKMHDGVKQLGTAMTFAPCGRANDRAVFVYYWKYLLLIIHIAIVSNIFQKWDLQIFHSFG